MSTDSASRPSFVILSSSGRSGRKSATAAAISSRSACSKRASVASRSSAAVPTGTYETPGVAVQRGVRRDHRHGRPAPRRLRGQREAHAPAGAIADVAHRVERLTGPAGGDQHAHAVQRPRRAAGDHLDRLEDRGRLGQPADAPLPARRELAGARLDHVHAARVQGLEVGLRRGVLVHAVVHRRRDQHRRGAREVGGGQEVVGLSRGKLGDRVRGRRCDAVGVAARGDLEVADRIVVGRRLARDTRRARGRARTPRPAPAHR